MAAKKIDQRGIARAASIRVVRKYKNYREMALEILCVSYLRNVMWLQSCYVLIKLDTLTEYLCAILELDYNSQITYIHVPITSHLFLATYRFIITINESSEVQSDIISYSKVAHATQISIC